MTLEEAIQILEEILEESRQYDGALIYISEYHWKALEMVIDTLKRSKWIPVTERLPEEGVEVLCSIDGDLCMTRLIVPKLFSNVVDAWTPLPKPYKKEGEEQ